MPTLLNSYLLGRHVTSVTIDGVTLSGTTLTAAGSPVTLTAVWKGHNINVEAETAEIGPSNSVRHNNVIIADGWTLDISVLRVNDGTDQSPLETLILGYDYLKITTVVGTSTSQRTTTLYGTRASYTANTEGRGEQIASLKINCIDVGGTDFYKVS